MGTEKNKKIKKLISFERSPAKMGEDYIFWIPRLYIKNHLIHPEKKYTIYCEEKVDDEEGEESD